MTLVILKFNFEQQGVLFRLRNDEKKIANNEC